MQCLEREKDIGKAHSSVADDSAEVRITRKKDTILANSPCRENRVAAECVNVRVVGGRAGGRAGGRVGAPRINVCPPLALSLASLETARAFAVTRNVPKRRAKETVWNWFTEVGRSRPRARRTIRTSVGGKDERAREEEEEQEEKEGKRERQSERRRRSRT